MYTRDDHTRCGTIVLECEAFLHGTLAEYWDDKGLPVPPWAWLNLLAHGSENQIRASIACPSRPRRASRSWRTARAYVAYALLTLLDAECTLADMQRSLLIPLEFQMAERPEVARWSPRQWADVVDVALHGEQATLEQ
jgi:hypothetical protein